MITIALLIAAGIAPTQARIFEAPLQQACRRFDITTPLRQAALIGQCMAESARFVHTEENLFYSTPERIRAVFPRSVPSLLDATRLARNPQALGNCVYADRMGNGGVDSGDGWAYRGRGLLQITGRDSYTDAGVELGVDYAANPDLVATPQHAALTAAWYWHVNKLNVLADNNQWDAITKAVNGSAMLHRDERRQLTEDALMAMARLA